MEHFTLSYSLIPLMIIPLSGFSLGTALIMVFAEIISMRLTTAFAAGVHLATHTFKAIPVGK